MGAASIWGLPPGRAWAAECARVGSAAMVDSCLAVRPGQEYDEDLLLVIGSPGAGSVLAGGEGGVSGYWPRTWTWALRALLYPWEDRASSVVIAATCDQAWRVREMAAKVIARHRIDDGLDAVGWLLTDPVPRVRATVGRAR